MARPAPGTERTVALLLFMASHRHESFTLSELARRLELNKATAHAMLAVLVEAGFLIRNPVNRTFSLGPALVTVGDAAAARPRVVAEFARGEMEQLAQETGMACLASAALGDEIVVLARIGSNARDAPSSAPGQRLPLTPPIGTVFLAWGSPSQIERWISGAAHVDTGRQDSYRRDLDTVRLRGYSVSVEADARAKLRAAIDRVGADMNVRSLLSAVELVMHELSDENYLLFDIDPNESYRLSHVAAPVFDTDCDDERVPPRTVV